MTDITERLRLRTDPTQMLMSYPARPAPDMLCYEAAAEIERMRAALSEIVEECHNTGYGDPTVMERMIDRIEETASDAMRERQND